MISHAPARCTSSRRKRLTCAAVGLALGALVVSGCGESSSGRADDPTSATGSGSASASAGSSTGSSAGSPGSAPATPTPTSSDPAGASSSPSAQPSRTPGCATSSLRARLGTGDGAAGSSFFELRLTNTSAQSCRIGGFGGVSLVTSPTGGPLGAPADRVRRSEVRRLVLAPGRTVSATLRQVEAGNYAATTCRPVQATGLRVYPPDQTRSLFVRHRATACRAPGVHLLSLTPYRLG